MPRPVNGASRLEPALLRSTGIDARVDCKIQERMQIHADFRR